MIYLTLSFLLIMIAFPVVLVGIGLPFKVSKGVRHLSDGTAIQHYDLPDWLLWLQNMSDGLTGDSRGWYWNIKMSGYPAWFKMLWWSGVRNPWNYLKRNIIGIDMRLYRVKKIAGQSLVKDNFENTGFQILKAIHEFENKARYLLYWVRRWGESDRAIVVQLGWKIKLSHNDIEEEKEYKNWKGFTFEINPYKDIS